MNREEWIKLMAHRMELAMREVFIDQNGHGLGFRINWTQSEPVIEALYYTPEEKPDEPYCENCDH